MNLPVVILCGGKGWRIRDAFPEIPKPLVKVGGVPIIERIIKHYSEFGCDTFILCLGYKGHEIVKHFSGEENAIKYSESYSYTQEFLTSSGLRKIQFINTGEDTPTGGRIFKIQHLIEKSKNFYCTYADGISDIDVHKLYQFHVNASVIATLTAVQPQLPYGLLQLSGDKVRSFDEKPVISDWINGGYFVFNTEIFDYLHIDSTLETDVLNKLAEEGQLAAYQHHGLWKCMDTYKDYQILNEYVQNFI